MSLSDSLPSGTDDHDMAARHLTPLNRCRRAFSKALVADDDLLE